ncbi:hypothetical protein CR513_59487, partial [Mucuna pruriens]
MKKSRERSRSRHRPNTSYCGTITTTAGGDTLSRMTTSARKRHLRVVMAFQGDAPRLRDQIICFSNKDYEGIPPHQDDPMLGGVPKNLIWIRRRASRDKGIQRDLDCVWDKGECTYNPSLLYSCQHLSLLQHDHRVVNSKQTKSDDVYPASLHEIPHREEGRCHQGRLENSSLVLQGKSETMVGQGFKGNPNRPLYDREDKDQHYLR